MNRRSYIKKTALFTAASVTSFGVFKWFQVNKAVSHGDFLSKRSVLEVLVDLIIPETDTPGAKSAMVHDYIILVMDSCVGPRQQHKFYSGIISLEDYANETYSRAFLDCSTNEQSAVLTYFSLKNGYSNKLLNKINNKFLGKDFFAELRDLTVEGYCLSKKGATQGLAYDYIPGTYQACIPLSLHQKSWATK